MKKNKDDKKKKVRIIHVGRHKKTVIALWVVLIMSICFGVYKNFTAVDTHTVHEKEVIKEKISDTNSIENFVADFAKVYYSWENNRESIDNRVSLMNGYLTEELQSLNQDTVRQDIPTCSYVNEIKIWNVKKKKDSEYTVTYSVTQVIKEGENTTSVVSSYNVDLYMDKSGNMVITKNPTLSNIPGKSSYKPKAVENDSSIDTDSVNEATEFLKTFFTLYPSATEDELKYYVKDNVLKPVSSGYVFSELVNPVFTKDKKDNIICHVTVKYLDTWTKATQISQYTLKLQKGDNWMIIGVE